MSCRPTHSFAQPAAQAKPLPSAECPQSTPAHRPTGLEKFSSQLFAEFEDGVISCGVLAEVRDPEVLGRHEPEIEEAKLPARSLAAEAEHLSVEDWPARVWLQNQDGGQLKKVAADRVYRGLGYAMKAARQSSKKIQGIFLLCQANVWGSMTVVDLVQGSYDEARIRADAMNAGVSKRRKVTVLPPHTKTLRDEDLSPLFEVWGVQNLEEATDGSGKSLLGTGSGLPKGVIHEVGVSGCEDRQSGTLREFNAVKDASSCCDIARRCMMEYALKSGAICSQIRTLGKADEAGRTQCWISEIASEIVGMIAMLPVSRKNHPGFSEIPTIELKHFFVKQKFRRRGIGESLFQHVKNRALQDDFRRIFLQTSRRFEAARRFYGRVGFRVIKTTSMIWEVDFMELLL